MSLYRKGITLIAAVTLGGFALVGCASTSVGAGSSGATATSATSAVTTTVASPVPSTSSAPPGTTTKAPAAPTLGPDGFGALKLGMSRANALATGLITDAPAAPSGCAGHKYKAYKVAENSFPVGISSTKGVSSLFAVGDMRTPEGIHLGSTKEQVSAAYPAIEQVVNGHVVKVPGNVNAYYTMLFDKSGKLRELGLAISGQECFG
ncbi:hypothetical protein SAMN05192558_108325 [Actinokineospora alba]|uniref:Uncharacterized protein n=1 Tax=Actinokineospora alba TaxID=504798 RepID=A0A1H0S860_9PSEU|nr:hypothetical protein [Actinokineospora alba]TDP66724.1 hypothetical protein C8E96_2236 [Actinokineospora alba]SDI51048.1 hypothetical protein SAMN05421871_105336 [Actinokineospora alba]SDP37835.1 hypothetical protein SAMN05192558_108325 [Actinokineospora alba]